MLSDNVVSLNGIRILQEDLLQASFCERKDESFVDYTFKAMKEFIDFDSGCFGTANVGNDLRMGLVKTFSHEMSNRMLVDYGKWNTTDPFFKKLVSQPGKPINKYDVYDNYDIFLNSEMFHKFHKVYGLYHTIGITFNLPSTNKFLFLTIIRQDIKNPFGTEESYFVQAIFSQLFGLWCGRWGLYNYPQEEIPTAEFTISELEIIALFADETKDFTSKQLAKKLRGKSPRTVEHQLDDIYEKLKITGTGASNSKKIQLIKIARSLPNLIT